MRSRGYIVARVIRTLDLLAVRPLSAREVAEALEVDTRTARAQLEQLRALGVAATVGRSPRVYLLARRPTWLSDARQALGPPVAVDVDGAGPSRDGDGGEVTVERLLGAWQRAARAYQRFACDAGASGGLTAMEFAVVLELAIAGPLDRAHLARVFELSIGGATAVTQRLAALDWIEQLPHPSDRHDVLFCVSKGAQAKLRDCFAPLRERLDGRLGGVSVQQRCSAVGFLLALADAFQAS